MEYSISISELVSRPKIREDKYPEFLNKMTDEEIEQYFKEANDILDEKKIPRSFSEWNSAQLAQLIDRNILYNLFSLNLSKDNKKTVWIGLSRIDLQKLKEDLSIDEIDLYSFRATSLSKEDIGEADLVIFVDDNDGKIKELKNRWGAWPLNK